MGLSPIPWSSVLIDRLHALNALRRELGLADAVLLGLGSIIGTGVYVSIAIAAGVGGPLVIPGIVLAAAVASCNALSSAELAASHPVSGGTYEYGYRYLTPWLGFSAGWMFICAKTASAATAALGVAAYVLRILGLGHVSVERYLAMALVLCLTATVVMGIRASATLNRVLVALALLGLVAFILAVAPRAMQLGALNLLDFSGTSAAISPVQSALRATALMFVAFTGYARIATLGEEVRAPRRTIPLAIIATLWISATLYLFVACAAISGFGAARFAGFLSTSPAPLEIAVQATSNPVIASVVAVGAIAAMLGVLLNLLLGLSRVMVAMGRRGDAPRILGSVSVGRPTLLAVALPGLLVAGIAFVTGVKAAWSFSAFNVLVYYALTNLAALQLKPDARLVRPAAPIVGLVACLGLAVFIEWQVAILGMGLLAVGLLGHLLASRMRLRSSN